MGAETEKQACSNCAMRTGSLREQGHQVVDHGKRSKSCSNMGQSPTGWPCGRRGTLPAQEVNER